MKTSACKAALSFTYASAPAMDKLKWKDGSDRAAVQNVRQAFYEIEENPDSRVRVSLDVILRAGEYFKNEIEKLIIKHNDARNKGQVANTQRLQLIMESLSEPVKRAQEYVELRERAKSDLNALAIARGVSFTDEEIKRLKEQQKNAHRDALKRAATHGIQKPFAETKKK